MVFEKGWKPSKETRQKMREAKLRNPTKMFGKNNPATKEEVRHKISETVKERWAEGRYDARINGMLGKTGWDHHNVKNLDYQTYSRYWHEDKCYSCGCTDKKIDIHHIDEDVNNWTLTNLIPLCVFCHGTEHLKTRVRPFATVTKEFRFEAAHSLVNSYSGLCDNIHGHSYTFEISIRRRMNKDDIVIDYSELKEIVNLYVTDVLDHSNLNDILPGQTSAENTAIWIWDVLEKDALLKGIIKVSVKETGTSRVDITPKDIMSFMEDQKLWIENRLTDTQEE